jgi:aminopeptidase N
MADANDADLEQFSRWYRIAGTPTLEVTGTHDAKARTYTLSVRQVLGATPGQPGADKPPLLIPITMGLLDAEGAAIALKLAGAPEASSERVLWLREPAEDFVFEEIASPPVPSLLRGFSAPVRLDFPYSDAELGHLVAHDANAFNRWDAAQKLATRLIKKQVGAKAPATVEEKAAAALIEAFRALLTDGETDPGLAAEALALPRQTALALEFDEVNVAALDAAHSGLKQYLARQLESEWLAAYERSRAKGAYQFNPQEAARRRLHGASLGWLCASGNAAHLDSAEDEFGAADNMTDRLNALGALAAHDAPQADRALAEFRKRYEDNPLVLDKWFALQAASPRPEALARVEALQDDPVFQLKNPNRVRALLGSFARANHAGFHAEGGAAYRFVEDKVLALDAFNPQVAARLVGCFAQWQRYDKRRQGLMREQLERIAKRADLSRDVYEIVTRTLGE